MAFVGVVEKVRRYDPNKSFEAWLLAVAHNLAIDHLRHRHPESLDDPLASATPTRQELTARDPDALESFLAQERADELTTILAELPATSREVLTLRFEEEMKLEEIAEVTATPLSTVKSRLRRALESLRHRLEGRLSGGDWK
jgi:RNA polymerase sigma-70 factor (ECF subfamily)